MQQRKLLQLLPLFFVIMIDSMGIGILFPIISDLLISHHSNFLPSDTSRMTRELLYGVTIGIYMVAWFFGSAVLGDLSDSVGRKKSLLICLVGATAGYFISAIAILFHNLFFLIVGRVIAGFTAGSQPIAQAAIVDVSAEEHRARNIGYVLFAVSIGFVLGPLMGGFFSNPNLSSWFNDSTPLFCAGLLSFINCIFLYYCFEETFKATRAVKLRLTYAIQIFMDAFKSKRIRLLSLVLLVETAGWSNYYTFISQLLLRDFHYTVSEISFFMMVLAVGFSVGFGFLVDRCARRYNLKKCVTTMLFVSSVICFISAVTNSALVLWVSAFLMGIFVAIFYSLLITLFSNQVSADEQGWVMGITNAVGALSFGITAFISGFVANWSASLPIYLGAVGLATSGVILHFSRLMYTKHE